MSTVVQNSKSLVVPSHSSAVLYGKGIFTTIAFYDGIPFCWEKHWKRLATSARKINLDFEEYSEKATNESFIELSRKSKLTNGRGRITLFDESKAKIWSFDSEPKTGLGITIAEMRPISADFRLTVSRYTVNSLSPLAGIKSCNYLEPIMSLDEAKGRGFHEAIRVNERGFVTSACMANVFWLKGGELFTPSLATGCLSGTTREFVLENIDCREVEVGVEALDDAEAIFLTSAGVGVVQVAEFEGKRFETADHPILHLLPY